MLQAMKEEPPLSAKCKDKFLIQSTFITSAKESLPLHEIVGVTSPLHPYDKLKKHTVECDG
jgi:vesicle-associated membrane protein-associated protein A